MERAAATPFVLHDGPPYANGDLHMGHFLNKVLKDTINRWQMLKGRRVHYQPGWDCHGLPIEIRALQQAAAAAASAGDGAAPPSLAEEPLLLREAAAACAHEAMAGQLASFERWGVMGAWDAPYTTMQPAYEAAELGVLRSLLRHGLIYRGRRPVHWSPATRTALAEAELEYPEGHTSVAAYIGFGLLPPAPPPRAAAASQAAATASATAATAATALPADVAAAMGAAGGVLVPIWTTTPWTIPANQAVCANADLEYLLVTVAPGSAGSGSATQAAGGSQAAVEAQALKVRRLKDEGLRNKEPRVAAAVAELLRLKALLAHEPTAQDTERPQQAQQAQQAAAQQAIGQQAVGQQAVGLVGRTMLVAAARLEAVQAALGVTLRRRPGAEAMRGAELQGLRCAHPLSGRAVPLLCAPHVTDAAGTGFVHTAPAHGPEDFEVGEQHGLSLACAVDEAGRFSTAQAVAEAEAEAEAGEGQGGGGGGTEAAAFDGLAVLAEGNAAVLDALRQLGPACLLGYEAGYAHRYAYDWRSKTPVIYRTTPQVALAQP
jgi:isoleucyl-tRNA synthetase